jgi:hypothetical protein
MFLGVEFSFPLVAFELSEPSVFFTLEVLHIRVCKDVIHHGQYGVVLAHALPTPTSFGVKEGEPGLALQYVEPAVVGHRSL